MRKEQGKIFVEIFCRKCRGGIFYIGNYQWGCHRQPGDGRPPPLHPPPSFQPFAAAGSTAGAFAAARRRRMYSRMYSGLGLCRSSVRGLLTTSGAGLLTTTGSLLTTVAGGLLAGLRIAWSISAISFRAARARRMRLHSETSQPRCWPPQRGHVTLRSWKALRAGTLCLQLLQPAGAARGSVALLETYLRRRLCA